MNGVDMWRIELSELQTLIMAIVALFVGGWVRRSIPALARIDIPNAVVGAAIVATLVLLGQLYLDIDVVFGSRMRDALLLVFFTSIGLSAKLHALVAGGKPLMILCLVTVLVLVAQNVGGATLAVLWGAHPAFGVLIGSLSFVGGPGTAMAWASQLESEGLANASLVGVGASTLAIVAGALVAGPVTGWIIRRHKLHGKAEPTDVTFAIPDEPAAAKSEASSIEGLLASVLVIATAVFLGEKINEVGRFAGIVLPGFLSAMIAGVVITNLADLFRYKLDFVPIERGGAVALQLFLVTALMATPLISVAQIIVPLALNVAIQIGVTVAVAYFVLFRLLGRDYDAAVTVGGFLGFGLASMPVAMGTMDEVAKRYGPSPKAFLLITLAGSFFVDLANAFIAKGFLSLPFFAISAAAG
jgi:glutamate:Na+ symporter, ESS family